MFDSVLRPGQLPHRRLGSGSVIAIVLHAGVAVGAIAISLRPPDALKKDAATVALPDPTMEDTFIALVERQPALDARVAA